MGGVKEEGALLALPYWVDMEQKIKELAVRIEQIEKLLVQLQKTLAQHVEKCSAK